MNDIEKNKKRKSPRTKIDGMRLRLGMTARRMGYRELGEQVGICYVSIFHFGTGRYLAAISIVRKIERVLKLPAGFLTGRGSLNILEKPASV